MAAKPDAAHPVGFKDLKPLASPAKKVKSSIAKDKAPDLGYAKVPRTYKKTLLNKDQIVLPKYNVEEVYTLIEESSERNELNLMRKLYGPNIYYLTPKLAGEVRLKPGQMFWGIWNGSWHKNDENEEDVSWIESQPAIRTVFIERLLFQGYYHHTDFPGKFDYGNTDVQYKPKFEDGDDIVVEGFRVKDCYNQDLIKGIQAQKRRSFGNGEDCDPVYVFLKDKSKKP